MCIVQYINNQNNTLKYVKKSNIISIIEQRKYIVYRIMSQFILKKRKRRRGWIKVKMSYICSILKSEN